MSRNPNPQLTPETFQRKYKFSLRDLEEIINEWWVIYYPGPDSMREIKDSIRKTKLAENLIKKAWFRNKSGNKAQKILKDNLQWLNDEKDKMASKGGPYADIAFNVLLLSFAPYFKIDGKIQWQDLLWLIGWSSKNILCQTDFKSLTSSTNERHLKSRYERALSSKTEVPKKLLRLIKKLGRHPKTEYKRWEVGAKTRLKIKGT